MPYYAQLNENKVVTSVTQTSQVLETSVSIIELDHFDTNIAGHTYDPVASSSAGKPIFISPAPVIPQYLWYIDIGPFFDRFGAAKMAVLTSSDVGVQAIIKDTQVRKWLDLKLPEIASALAYIGTKVTSVTQELQESILKTPVAEADNLALRKLYFS